MLSGDYLVDAASATTSATNAANSATAAATSETNAATSESNAATSETNAAASYDSFDDRYLGAKSSNPSVDNDGDALLTGALFYDTTSNVTKIYTGSAWENIAQNSIDAAATSATNASTSATNSANSATASAASASAAEATFDLFDDTYLGAKASNPTVDNDGNALQDGALYFDTTNDVMKVYNLANTTWYQLTPTVSNQTNINTVAGISSDVTSVANISSDVTATANNNSNITTVAGQITPTNNVSTLAGVSSSISTLSPISSNITTVAGISGDVTSVANISTAVSNVNSNSTNINTVATDLTGSNNIGTVSGSITNVNNVGGSIANVNTVAGNLSGVNYFGERYRVSATAPTTSLDIGDLYYDTATDAMKVYGSSGWQNAGSSVNGTSQRYNYTATSGQTTFTGADNNGNTLSYDAGYIDVYLNGSKLLNATDVTVTSGSSVVLASGATTGDVVDIVAYGTFSVASLNADNLDSGTVPSARITGAYTGITNLTMTGDLTVDTNTLFVKSSTNKVGIGTTTPLENLTVESSSFPIVAISNNSATNPTNGVALDLIERNTSSVVFGESGCYGFRQFLDGNANRFDIISGNQATTNTRLSIERDTGNIGIGTTSPSQALDVVGSIEVSDGIYIGGTAAANKLDDYEEGTWTPTLENGVVSYTSQTGQYIKIGKLVYFQGTIVLSSNNTADTSSVRIGSLPFTIDTTNESALFTMDASGSTLFDNYHNVGGAGFTSPNNINIGDTSNGLQIQYADLQSSGQMVFSGQYIAT